MIKLISIILCCCFSCTYAQDQVVLEQGKISPFTGVLLSEEKYIKHIQLKIDYESLKKLNVIESESCTNQINLYQTELKSCQKATEQNIIIKIFEEYDFVVGIAIGSIATVLILNSLSNIQN